ncbi:MAG TPA: glucose 1-dehydrogenase [Acidimicrobiia bacterium]|nr:glucose 1-dehydrogenase [Acidimicrobiia bacterium]
MGALEGRKAVVAGGGRGIGRAIALAFAAEGADVAVVGRDPDTLTAVADEIRAAGRTAVGVSQDLTQVAEIPDLFDRLAAELGGLDILVNSAGVQITGPSTEVTEEQWDTTMDANLKSMFFSCQAAGGRFIDQGRGKIINLASTFSFVGFPEFAAYCSSKGGVALLTKTLAAEWASSGVNVNAIAPTAVRTEMNAYLLDDPDFLGFFLPKVPAGRVGDPSDVAGAAVFLAGAGSDFVNGHILLVDGGYTAV